MSGCAKPPTLTPVPGKVTNPTVAATETTALTDTKQPLAATATRSRTSAPQESTATPTEDASGGGVLRLSFSDEAMKGAETIAEEVPGFKEEMYYFGAPGGGGEYSFLCDLTKMAEPPFICFSYGNMFYDSNIDLHIVGFPENLPVQIDLYQPDGKFLTTFRDIVKPHMGLITLEENDNDSATVWVADSNNPIEKRGDVFYNDMHWFTIPMWNPVGMPEGDWRVVASMGDIRQELLIPMPDPSRILRDEPKINTLPSLSIDPFVVQNCGKYKAGEIVYIAGNHFQANQNINLGVYYETGQQDIEGYLLRLLFGTQVKTSAKGDFIARYTINPSTPDGRYIAIPMKNQDAIGYSFFFSESNCFIVTSGNPTPTPKPTEFACYGAPETRLKVGDIASVSLVPPDPNTVRKEPNKKAQKLGSIQPGEKVEILDGPICANNWVWWKVKSLESGLTGWTPEGDPKNYWLVPEE
jgi:hypothetical protein